MGRKPLSPEAKSIVFEILSVNSRLMQRYSDEFELDHIDEAGLKTRLRQQAEILREVCSLLEDEETPKVNQQVPDQDEKKSA